MSPSPHKRPHRVGHLIQQELGQMLIEGIKDPRVGFVTVTEVRLTPDLREACVYVSIFGDDAVRQTSLAGLRAASGYLRRELGSRLTLRYAPELTFAHDDTLDRAQRLEVVLAAAASGAVEPPPQDALPPLPPAETGREMPPPPPLPARPQPARRGARGRTKRRPQR